MLHRGWFSLYSLHISFFVCPFLLFSSDKIPNPDVLAKQAGGKIISQIPVGGAATMTGGTPQIPSVPMDIHPNLPDTGTSGSNSNLGGVVGLVINLGKTSEVEKAAATAQDIADRALRAKTIPEGMHVQGRNVLAQFFPNEYDDYGNKLGAALPSVDEIAARIQQASPMTFATPTIPIVAAPIPTPPSFSFPQGSVLELKKMSGFDPSISAEFLKKAPTVSGPPVSLSDVANGTASTAAGGLYAYTTGTLSWVAGGAQTAFWGAVALAQAHPVIAATTVTLVVGGAWAHHQTKLNNAEALRKSIAESVAHREIHNALPHTEKPTPPQPEYLKGPRNTKKKKNSEIRHEIQTGDPRLNGEKPFIIEHAGQGKPHGFKDQWGHYAELNPKTKERTLLCYEKGTYHGKNADGKHVITMTCPESGKQLYVHVLDNGGIANSGINPQHFPIDPIQKLPYQPEGFVKPKGPGHGDTLKKVAITGGGAAALSPSSATASGLPSSGYDPFFADPFFADQFIIPQAPSDIPTAPTEARSHRQHRKSNRLVEDIADQYEAKLDPTLSPDQKMNQKAAAREFLSKQGSL